MSKPDDGGITMSKKKKGSGKSADISPKAKTDPANKEASQHSEKPFDYGGLPDRDLKKNLGCG